MEAWELRREALQREFEEELWVTVDVWELVYVHEYQESDLTVIEFWYWIKNPKVCEHVDLSTTTHGYELAELRWFDLDTKKDMTLDAEVQPSYLFDCLQKLL